MNNIFKTQALNVPEHHIFQMDVKMNISAEHLLLYIALLHARRSVEFKIENLTLILDELNIPFNRREILVNAILTLYGFEGFNFESVLIRYEDDFVNNQNKPFLYMSDNGRIEAVPDEYTLPSEVMDWLTWILTSMPDNIALPKVNLFKVNDDFFTWIQTTPRDEQLSVFILMHELGVEWSDWFNGQAFNDETTLFING